MKAIWLAAFLIIAVISIYTHITSLTKRNKTEDFALWKKYNRRIHIANSVSTISGLSVGTLLGNIFQYGW